MAFSLRAIANNRYEVKDDKSKQLLALALGRKSGELIITALNAYCGPGEQLELDIDKAA